MTWEPDYTPDIPPPRGAQWLLVGARLLAMALVLLVGAAVMVLLRVVERPLCGQRRPVTPWITVAVCRLCVRIMGVPRRVDGRLVRGPALVVANHVSWMDIFVLNACGPVYFVSKAEVAGWPGIGALARITGTLFIRRDRREAAAQAAQFRARLDMGHRMLLFPEGTSTDGCRVLPFKPTLFAGAPDGVAIQPVSLVYTPPKGAPAEFYGWVGHVGFGEHLMSVLARWRHGSIGVVLHPALDRDVFDGRKALARAAEDTVRAPLEAVGVLVPDRTDSPDEAPRT